MSHLRERAAWAAAGLATLALAAVLALRPGAGVGGSGAGPAAGVGGGEGAAGAGVPLGPTSAVDLSSMTPREAAIRLFNRVMTAMELGSRAEAGRFLPMAIASYDRIAALTLDDRFRLSLLHAAAGDGASARAVADAGLAVRPTHILLLAASAEGAIMVGDDEAARARYGTLVEVYEQESRAGLAEYGTGEGGQGGLLPVLRAEAEAFLAGEAGRSGSAPSGGPPPGALR